MKPLTMSKTELAGIRADHRYAGAILLQEVDTCHALIERLEEEADAAAMRSALRGAREFAISVGQENPLDDGDVRQVEACEAALASYAGEKMTAELATAKNDLVRSEADAAAMREALASVVFLVASDPKHSAVDRVSLGIASKALSSDAGAALLTAHKAEVDKLRKLCGEAAEMQDRILTSAVMGWQGYGWADDASDLAVRLKKASR